MGHDEHPGARVARVLTAPALLVTVTLVALWFWGNGVFDGPAQLVCPLLCLGVLPALAYPVQRALPSLEAQGRAGQRRLAFGFSVVGYALGFGLGCAGLATPRLLLMYLTYLVSVVLLVALNALGEKASGHACSTTGSLVFAGLYLRRWYVVGLCLAVWAVMAWSSLALGRHSARNLVSGTLTCFAALGVSWGALTLAGVL